MEGRRLTKVTAKTTVHVQQNMAAEHLQESDRNLQSDEFLKEAIKYFNLIGSLRTLMESYSKLGEVLNEIDGLLKETDNFPR